MNVLIVEDDENTIAVFQEQLERLGLSATFARSRESALAALKATTFDVVINDLKIPAVDGLASDQDHGIAVHSHVQEHSPGTPVIIFSGFGTIPLVSQFANKSIRCDVWASGREIPMTQFLAKDDLPACIQLLKDARNQLQIVESVEISTGSRDIELTPQEKRVLQLFGRFNDGVNVRIQPLGGGLSATKVFRITVEDAHGVPTSHAVGKIGPIDLLEEEVGKYDKFVAPILSIGGFAHVIRFCKAGAGNIGGLFYGLASSHDKTLFDVLKTDPASATAVVARLKQLEEAWQERAVLKETLIADLRREFVDDAKFETFASQLGFNWEKLESRSVRIPVCRQHRDLHGLNVLIKDGVEPLLIDFGEVGTGPACIDSLTLELSVLFHPAAKELRGTWPTADQALKWDNLAEYERGTPLQPFIHACREWSNSIARRDSIIFATMYVYAVRQLKYPNTPHDLAINLSRVANRRLVN